MTGSTSSSLSGENPGAAAKGQSQGSAQSIAKGGALRAKGTSAQQDAPALKVLPSVTHLSPTGNRNDYLAPSLVFATTCFSVHSGNG